MEYVNNIEIDSWRAWVPGQNHIVCKEIFWEKCGGNIMRE